MRLVLTVAVASGALWALPAYGLGLWHRTPAARWSTYRGRHRDTPGSSAQVGWVSAQRQVLAHELRAAVSEVTQELPVVRRLAIGWRDATVQIPVAEMGQPIPAAIGGAR